MESLEMLIYLFCKNSTYEKELIYVLSFTITALRKVEMEYNGKFWHTLGRIQNIAIMRIIEICYTACRLVTQTVAPTLPVLQGLNICIKYLDSHPHKLIFYPFNYYDGSNVTGITWIGNQLEY